MNQKKRLACMISFFVIVMLACNAVNALTKDATPKGGNEVPSVIPPAGEGQTPEGESQPPPELDEASIPQFIASEVYLVAFADYPAEVVKLPQQFQAGYTLPIDLNNVNNVDSYELSDAQKALLAKNGFVVQPSKTGEFREFYQIYEMYRYTEDQPIFITTDSVLHIYHLIFDKMLRDLEREFFIPYLQELTASMVEANAQQFKQVAGTTLEEPSLRNWAYFVVADQLLGSTTPVPAQVADLVKAELDLINAHAGVAISPIWNRPDLADDMKLVEDYSQYIPRGHYTIEERLGRYFKAMMWYGRLTFRIADAYETRRALLLVQAIRNAPDSKGIPAQQLWDNIYSPTTFIVGKADDLSTHEYGVVSDSIFGATPDLKTFTDDAQLARFTQAIKKLPPPQINSMWVWIWQEKAEVTPGLRFMGQRFTLDAYVFGQMMYRNVGTIDDPRDLPKALDFFSAMGSEEALNILNTMGENKYENYTKQMEKVKKEVAALDED